MTKAIGLHPTTEIKFALLAASAGRRLAHEERRLEAFLGRKVTSSVAVIKNNCKSLVVSTNPIKYC